VPRNRRFIPVLERLRETHPELTDPVEAVRRGRVLIAGAPVTNPRALVPCDGVVLLRAEKPLRGQRKLAVALDSFEVHVADAVALDAGAAAGGFTKALLDAGAARVYAVDVGFGQLLGALRQDDRVVVLERTNIASLTPTLVPEPIDLITVDLSYVPVAKAIPQFNRLRIRTTAELVALIKPIFELQLPGLPTDDRRFEIIERVASGLAAAGWHATGWRRSPVLGRRGARELLVHAKRV
jgi:23S rRNA (cytidine1920-2'-O)/16S rRNA (cytidine1409-2'-O)-methyltransferase